MKSLLDKLKSCLPLYLCLLAIDLISHFIVFENYEVLYVLRTLFFNAGLTLLIEGLCFKLKDKTALIVKTIILIVFGIYSFAEMEFMNLLEVFYSFRALRDGGFRVNTMVSYFITDAKMTYWLVFVPAVLYLIFSFKKKNENRINILFSLFGAIVMCLSIFTLSFGNESLVEAYKSHENLEILVENLGTNAFLFRDVYKAFGPAEDTIDVIEIIEEEDEEEIVPEEVSLKRDFNDSRWISVMNNETNDNLKTIDLYLLSRSIDDKNEMTGVYEGYNFVYFLVESFDYMAIDEVLTPTIYKMYKEGMTFSNHYTPVYVCGTGDSELVSMTSCVPYGSNCTIYSMVDVDLKQSLGGLFKNAGYKTMSFHNWDDTFYNRTAVHANYGMDMYLDIDDLDFKIVEGWQSDSYLVEKALEYMNPDEPFFSYIVTSTMHWPYDYDSYYGNLHVKEIGEVHPDYPLIVKRYLSKSMEFDKALETLVNGLEEKGILDNTVICFWPDHHPLKTDISIIKKYSIEKNRYDAYGLYLSPLIIYRHGDEPLVNESYCATADHLPTIANLFNLNYDPRLYAGNDIFSGNSKVLFPNGNWISDEGYYIYNQDTFYNHNDEVVENDAIRKKISDIRNMIKIGRAMLNNNYFKDREFIIDPINR